MGDNQDDERFQLAFTATRRVVAQCRAHVQKAVSKLEARTGSAPATSSLGVDLAAARSGRHGLAFEQRVTQIESGSNALRAHLDGLHVLLQHDTFLPIPAIPIARAIAEVCASLAWIVGPQDDADTRAARGYAALFRAIHSSTATSPDRARELREEIIGRLNATGVTVIRKADDKGRLTDDVAQVRVGRANAKTTFQYSHRIATEIPLIAGVYAGMSGVAHGELLHLSSTWDTPDTHARLIGFVVERSVIEWSAVIHSWIGVEAGPFLNQADLDNLIRSMPPDFLAEFAGR